MNAQRLETSRLLHRFGFGPRPGEYAKALADGVAATRTQLLTVPAVDAGAAKVVEPEIIDLGQRPKQNTKEIVPFAIAMRYQTQQMLVWWLDRMAASDHGLTERMTWFWHGHWATSIKKLNYPLPMFKQNNTLRATCLGNFATMTKAMINDGALQFWLDGQDNTAKAPNENLGRELMELFTLGVGRYSEDDVKSISRVLTGYQVVRSNGVVTVNQNRRDKNPVTLLGTTGVFTGDSLADFLVARDDSAKFVAERLWYRFVSSTEDMPANFVAQSAFSNRDISAAVAAMASDAAMRDEKYAMVQQIRRAALSVHLNIAEGSSRKSEAERKRYYEIARGSVIEIDAAFDIAYQLLYCEMESLKLLGELIISSFKQLSGIIASNSKST